MSSDRFYLCPGGAPAIGAHPPTIFPRLKTCKNKSVTGACIFCGSRLFGNATGFWPKGGLTRDQVLTMCPVAVDGNGRPV